MWNWNWESCTTSATITQMMNDKKFIQLLPSDRWLFVLRSIGHTSWQRSASFRTAAAGDAIAWWLECRQHGRWSQVSFCPYKGTLTHVYEIDIVACVVKLVDDKFSINAIIRTACIIGFVFLFPETCIWNCMSKLINISISKFILTFFSSFLCLLHSYIFCFMSLKNFRFCDI